MRDGLAGEPPQPEVRPHGQSWLLEDDEGGDQSGEGQTHGECRISSAFRQEGQQPSGRQREGKPSQGRGSAGGEPWFRGQVARGAQEEDQCNDEGCRDPIGAGQTHLRWSRYGPGCDRDGERRERKPEIKSADRQAGLKPEDGHDAAGKPRAI